MARAPGIYRLFCAPLAALALGLSLAVSPQVSVAQSLASAPVPVCGTGDRPNAGCAPIRARQIVDAARPPWSAIGRLDYGGHDGIAHCTGTLVSARLVLTAAHCLFDPAGMGWIALERLQFVAGYQYGTHRGISTIARVVTDPALPQDQTAFHAPPALDWALLVLAQPVTADLVPLPLFRGNLRLVGPGKAQFAGYAGLRPYVLSRDADCGQPITAGGRLIAGCAAMPGDSGGPLLWQSADNTWSLLGVLSALRAGSGPHAAEFVPWFRLRAAMEQEIANGN